jgi:hypothetical protein
MTFSIIDTTHITIEKEEKDSFGVGDRVIGGIIV